MKVELTEKQLDIILGWGIVAADAIMLEVGMSPRAEHFALHSYLSAVRENAGGREPKMPGGAG
jgi:hypothetical protein